MLGQTNAFMAAWKQIKDKITTLRKLPSLISSLRKKAISLRKRAERVGAPTKEIEEVEIKAGKMEPLASKVKEKIDRYLPEWQSEAERFDGYFFDPGSFGEVGVVVAVALTIAGLAAVAYVSTKGLRLYKDYTYETRVLASLEKNVISLEEAKGLIKAPIAGAIAGAISPVLIFLLLAGAGSVWLVFNKQKEERIV